MLYALKFVSIQLNIKSWLSKIDELLQHLLLVPLCKQGGLCRYDELRVTLDKRGFASNGYFVDEMLYSKSATKSAIRKGKVVALLKEFEVEANALENEGEEEDNKIISNDFS